jgi:hypothetical protein
VEAGPRGTTCARPRPCLGNSRAEHFLGPDDVEFDHDSAQTSNAVAWPWRGRPSGAAARSGGRPCGLCGRCGANQPGENRWLALTRSPLGRP